MDNVVPHSSPGETLSKGEVVKGPSGKASAILFFLILLNVCCIFKHSSFDKYSKKQIQSTVASLVLQAYVGGAPPCQ